MFTVNGKKLEYDVFELEKAELFEREMGAVVDKMNALQSSEGTITLAQSIRTQCEAIAECFDRMFGEGTAAKIFDGRVNLRLALKAYEELVSGINAEKRQIEKIARATASKYGMRQTKK
ncbi:MAG: hypothetical protein KH847_00220 [Clostridiales bacterium]|jgi:hypothetical protein|nr:hypothetical protein [Clostridiales bacterium]DAK44046.1 MAG TPA: hypothetical protein [Caudoviricetes sp.]